MNQIDLLYELFKSFLAEESSQDFDFDNCLVCRWYNGQARISPRISKYYMYEKNRERLIFDIEKNILYLMEMFQKSALISAEEKQNFAPSMI